MNVAVMTDCELESLLVPKILAHAMITGFIDDTSDLGIIIHDADIQRLDSLSDNVCVVQCIINQLVNGELNDSCKHEHYQLSFVLKLERIPCPDEISQN